MKNRLAPIIEYKRVEVDCRIAAFGASFVRDALFQSPPRGFRAALEAKSADGWPALIAEIKKASPSAGLIRHDFDPPDLAAAYEAGGAACLSVLTDAPSFQGSEAHLRAAREACGLPVLRKDFLIDPWQVVESRAIGADAVLVILAAVDDALAADLLTEAARHGMDVLVECHDAGEVERAAALGANIIGVNNRDLRSLQVDLSTSEALVPQIPESALRVAESGVHTARQVERMHSAGAQAVLVGESLMREGDVEAATRTLLKRPYST